MSPAASPAALAERASGGAWKRYAHLQLLNEYLLKFAYGHIKRLMISMPPQHGKSELVSHYFPAWYLGTFPEHRIILASYEASFARSWGRKARDVMVQFGPEVFGQSVRYDRKAANDWSILGHLGGMVTSGMRGGIAGKPANQFIIDDPIKDAKEANSKVVKAAIMDTYRSVARTRLAKNGGVLIMATRWAKDDLHGQILKETKEDWVILNLPAIAEKDEELGTSWRRVKGEALCEDLHPLSELIVTKGESRAYFWGALYQGRPTTKGGNFFKRAWFEVATEIPETFDRVVRYWDKASTEASNDSQDPDWTVGVLIGMKDTTDEKTGVSKRRYYILDVVRVQEGSAGVRSTMRQTAMLDGFDVEIRVEQEGGSSGKDVAIEFYDLFEGYAYKPDKPTSSKIVRAESFAAAVENGKVYLKKAKWNSAFLEEHDDFPKGEHDDQVDAASGAFRTLQTAMPSIDFA